MEIMNCYVMLPYATVRWINGSISYVTATTASDSRDKWLGWVPWNNEIGDDRSIEQPI